MLQQPEARFWPSARQLQLPAFMDTMKSVALAQRLEEAEAAVQRAYENLDGGSPESWTVLQAAKQAYREAEAEAVVWLGGHTALELVTSLMTPPELRLAG